MNTKPLCYKCGYVITYKPSLLKVNGKPQPFHITCYDKMIKPISAYKIG
jgi:hypothetical protein